MKNYFNKIDPDLRGFMSRLLTCIFSCYLFFFTVKAFAACPQFLGGYVCSSKTSDETSYQYSLVKVTNLASGDPFYSAYEIQDSNLFNGPLDLFIPVSDSNQEWDMNQVKLPVSGAYCTALNSLVVRSLDSPSEMLEYIPIDQSLWIKIYKTVSSSTQLNFLGNWQEVSFKKCLLISTGFTSPEILSPPIAQSTIDLTDSQPSVSHLFGIKSESKSDNRLKRKILPETFTQSERSRKPFPGEIIKILKNIFFDQRIIYLTSIQIVELMNHINTLNLDPPFQINAQQIQMWFKNKRKRNLLILSEQPPLASTPVEHLHKDPLLSSAEGLKTPPGAQKRRIIQLYRSQLWGARPPLLQLPTEPLGNPNLGINLGSQPSYAFEEMKVSQNSSSTSLNWISRSESVSKIRKDKSQFAKNDPAGKIKKHLCRICNKLFYQLSYLKRHHRIHTGEKPFACQWAGCKARFTERSNRQRHHQSHSGEKPFHCTAEGCQAAFSRKAHLDNHLDTHK